MHAFRSKRLFAVVVACLALVSYLGMRDTIKAPGHISKEDVGAVALGAQEWSSPKLFREIEVSRWRRDTNVLLVEIREGKHRWSVTCFTNHAGDWKKFAWVLVEEDRTALDSMLQGYR
jgi:hypothetical protein